jgi:hypothetical protein
MGVIDKTTHEFSCRCGAIRDQDPQGTMANAPTCVQRRATMNKPARE